MHANKHEFERGMHSSKICWGRDDHERNQERHKNKDLIRVHACLFVA